MTIDYRTPAQPCALCNEETDAHALQDLIGLDCCERCTSGDLKQAVQHWGFVVGEKISTSVAHRREYLLIEIKRPTFVQAFSRFGADSGPKTGWISRLFSRDDPQVGDQAFDDQVLIAPDRDTDEATMGLLEHAGVRAGVLALIQRGALVDLSGQSVWVHDSGSSRIGATDRLAEADDLLPYAVALAVHIERIARGPTSR